MTDMKYSTFFRKMFIILILGFPLFCVSAYADVDWNFSKAKKLAKDIYSGDETTFYCGCDYKEEGKKLIPVRKPCGYFPRNEFTKAGKVNSRSIRIEWEHVMPAWFFGNTMSCWKKGGRKACKKDKNFEKMESDLHNLVPAIGEINGDRSNFSFSNIAGEERIYGKCDFEIDFKNKIVEPRDAVRGDIARIYFYMSEKYNVPLPKNLHQMLDSWSSLDPVDAFELERDGKIALIQGNNNPFVIADKDSGAITKNRSVGSTSTSGTAAGSSLKGVEGNSNSKALSEF